MSIPEQATAKVAEVLAEHDCVWMTTLGDESVLVCACEEATFASKAEWLTHVADEVLERLDLTAQLRKAAVDITRAVIDYCRMSEEFASTGLGPGDGLAPEAVGLARAYKDVADKLTPRLAALEKENPDE